MICVLRYKICVLRYEINKIMKLYVPSSFIASDIFFHKDNL